MRIESLFRPGTSSRIDGIRRNHCEGSQAGQEEIITAAKFDELLDQLRQQLMQWSTLPDLRRILMSHGSPIVDTPRETLQELADSLA